MEPIYLDYNATTPLDPSVVEAMRPYLETHFGNPSSSHVYGRRAREAVETARGQIAGLLGAKPNEVILTGGGSESNNMAIMGVARALAGKGRHIVTSAVEHPAVAEVCRFLASEGFRITTVPVDETGLVEAADVERALEDDTVLVTIMHANNEVGTIQPIGEIASCTRRAGVVFHTDAAQSAGKIPVRVDELGVDLLTVAGHKLYAPKGVGALYVRPGTPLRKLIHGADHERGMRAGTENVASIVGLGRACELAQSGLGARGAHVKGLRERLHQGLLEIEHELRLNGHPEKRLPNTLNVSFRGVEAAALLREATGVAASAGAACHSESGTISGTLQAMGVPADSARGAVRFSTGMSLSEEDVDRAVECMQAAVRKCRI